MVQPKLFYYYKETAQSKGNDPPVRDPAMGGKSMRVGQVLGYDFDHVDNLNAELLACASEGEKVALEKIEAVMLSATKTTM